jgi:hypothetical protein
MKFVSVFILLFAASISSAAADPNSIKDCNAIAAVTDSNGPTVLLGYSKTEHKNNPIASFMYFVPLIAVSPVDRHTSVNNNQQMRIISYEKTSDSKSFSLVCEFRIFGTGYHKNVFDPAGMIASRPETTKRGQTLTKMLDYIMLEGEGLGRIEINGIMQGSTQTVTEVSIQFSARGHKSPVTVGLYDVEPVNGKYDHANRSHQIVARVNGLAFKKNTDPLMGMTLASINDEGKSESYWGTVKGVIANLFISPTPVDKLGNQTMLDFGQTLLQQKPFFTFPKAKNLKEAALIAQENK